MKRFLVLLLLGAIIFPGVSTAAPVQWADGHWYQFIPGKLTWEQANTQAAALTDLGLTWHLATVTSAAENTFVNALTTTPFDVWLGGKQLPNQATRDAGWQWVTGEAWSYTNWASGEPNDFGTPAEDNEENYLGYINGFYGFTGQNHDAPVNWFQNQGYFAEAVPIPAAVWLLGSGLVGMVVIRRKKIQ
jgi:hypothetical protein